MIAPSTYMRAMVAQERDRYVFGTEVSPLDPDPHKFDCSELVEWACVRAGLRMPDGAYNQWKACRRITVDEGLRTYGALLFGGDGTGVGRDAITHVAGSLGDGTTIEARGRKWGVGTWSGVGRFNFAGLIPGVRYGSGWPPATVNRGGGVQLLPGAAGQAVTFLQNMLNITRAHTHKPLITVDGIYGAQTTAAVVEFQRAQNAVTRRAALEVTGRANPATCQAIAYWVHQIVGR